MSLSNHYPLTRLRAAVQQDAFWNSYLNELPPANGLHLAVVAEPYLQLILDGQKSAESRFSKYRIAPYNSAVKGDVILLKKPGGPVLGICLIDRIEFYKLDPDTWYKIKKKYAGPLCIQDPGFWARKEEASYATIMELCNVRRIPPINIQKRDRRGWVSLRHHSREL